MSYVISLLPQSGDVSTVKVSRQTVRGVKLCERPNKVGLKKKEKAKTLQALEKAIIKWAMT